ncbi:MAG: SH3 domain-containing protein, partial [Caldilineaceae bacterium]
AVMLGLWWGLSRFGGNALDTVAAAGSGLTDRVAGLFASNDATATPDLGVLAATDASRAEAISTSVFGETTDAAAAAAGAGLDAATGTTGGDTTAPGFDSSSGGTSAPAVAAAAPTAEPPTAAPVEPTATPVPTLPPPTPTPAAQSVAVTTQANLRSAPALDATIAGAAEVGVVVNLVGQSSDGQWYRLDNGSWIFAQLVAAPAVSLPVVDPNAPAQVAAADPAAVPTTDPAAAALALPTATPPPAVEPTVAPAAPAIAAASCADLRSVISSPGQGQTVSGLVPIVGSASHEAFASYKLEAGPPGAAMAFIGSGNTIVQGGSLGTVDSLNFANGPLLVRLTVIDQTGNYPPPCEVTITVAN